MDDDVDDLDGGSGGYDLADIARISAAMRASDPSWGEGQVVGSNGLKWKAQLSKGNQHLHVHLASRIMPYMVKRLVAARSEGLRPHIALPLAALCNDALACELVSAEPMIHIIDDAGSVAAAEPLLVSLGKRWRVRSDARKVIGRVGWDLVRSSGLKDEKGERLEALLCFLLGQISDFEVSEHGLNTATEQIDVVVTIRASTGRCWSINGSPFVLVEAKNWHTMKVGQDEVSEFGFQMEHKRNSVRIGLLVSTLGFSPEAKMQTLRMSSEPTTIVLIGPDGIENWIDAEDGDAALEDLVRRAMLD